MTTNYLSPPDQSGQIDNRVTTTDFYEAAYYLTVGCLIDDIEVFMEMGKQRIRMTLKGDLIKSAQREYFTSQATVNLFAFRRSYQRLIQTIQDAKRKIHQVRKLQQQVKQTNTEVEE